MPVGENIPGEINIGGAVGTSPTTVIPQFQRQQSTTNLADGASVDFDFSVDTQPVFDAWVFSNVALLVQIFARISDSDTYRQIGGDIPVAASVGTQALQGRRVPGRQVRVRVLNSSGGASTTLEAQVTARSA